MGGALAEPRISGQFHFTHVFLAAQLPSAGHTLQQPHPRTVRLLSVAQHQDLLWILLLPLELLWTPRLPLGHPRSRPDPGHPSMPLTAARIPSVHPHRSRLDQLVSPLVYQGMLLSSSILIFLWLCFCCITLLFYLFVSFYLFLFNYCPLSYSLPTGFFWFLYCLSSHSLFSTFSPCCSRRPPGAPSHRPTIIRPAEPSLLD